LFSFYLVKFCSYFVTLFSFVAPSCFSLNLFFLKILYYNKHLLAPILLSRGESLLFAFSAFINPFLQKVNNVFAYLTFVYSPNNIINMALEAIVFPQDFFSYTNDESFIFGKGSYRDYETPIYELDSIAGENSWDSFYSLLPEFGDLDANSPCPPAVKKEKLTAHAAVARRKRRRTRNVKNREEIENQRMTHIAVERNRRRQMNEYLAILRSLMPQSYAQKV
jgi:Helix-loop-helix DNA-binding domain